MKKLCPLLIIPMVFVISCASKTKKINPHHAEIKDSIQYTKTVDSLTFAKVKAKYDSLRPIFDGLFITHNKEKWGVIDSNGNEIVPFKCDGIARWNDSGGIASVFIRDSSLHTGVPRYVYFGKYFFFNKKGQTPGNERLFDFMSMGMADWHKKEFIIQLGPDFFLPGLRNDSTQIHQGRFGIRIIPERISKIEMSLSAFGVEADDFPSISVLIDFNAWKSLCAKSYYNPVYKGSTYTLSAKEIESVKKLLDIPQLEKLNKKYTSNKSDQPISTTTIYTNKREFTFYDYGLQAPSPLKEIYKIVYKL